MTRWLCSFLCACPLLAQGPMFQETPLLPPTIGVNLQVGFPQGATEDDLNHGVGYGAAVSYCWHPGGRHLIRPTLSYDTYRITPPGPPAWATGVSDRHDFYAWTLAVDYLLYQEPWVHHGPYLLLSAGFQYSSVTHPVQNGTQLAMTNHRSSRTAPWFGAGVGYQFTDDIALEVRYSASSYAAQRGQRLTGYALTEDTARDDRFVHLILAVRAPL